MRRVRCLVVVPVGDLAAQVHKVFSDYCRHTELRVGLNCQFWSQSILSGARQRVLLIF